MSQAAKTWPTSCAIREPVAAEVALFREAFAVGGEVSEEVGPAELPLGGIEVVVAAPAVRADDPGEPLAEQRLGLERMPASGDPGTPRSGSSARPKRCGCGRRSSSRSRRCSRPRLS